MKKILGSILGIVAFGMSCFAQNSQKAIDKVYIDSLERTIKQTEDNSFRVFCKDVDGINKIMGDGYAQRRISFWISKEHVDPILILASKTKIEPKWDSLSTSVVRKFGSYYGNRTIIGAKVRWFSYVKNGAKLATYTVINISKYEGTSDSFLLSNAAWNVFLNSTKKSELNEAIKWSKMIIEREPNNAAVTDTYANILYKLGDVDKALVFQIKALELDQKNDEIRQHLQNMRSGIPTWIVSSGTEERKQ